MHFIVDRTVRLYFSSMENCVHFIFYKRPLFYVVEFAETKLPVRERVHTVDQLAQTNGVS